MFSFLRLFLLSILLYFSFSQSSFSSSSESGGAHAASASGASLTNSKEPRWFETVPENPEYGEASLIHIHSAPKEESRKGISCEEALLAPERMKQVLEERAEMCAMSERREIVNYYGQFEAFPEDTKQYAKESMEKLYQLLQQRPLTNKKELLDLIQNKFCAYYAKNMSAIINCGDPEILQAALENTHPIILEFGEEVFCRKTLPPYDRSNYSGNPPPLHQACRDRNYDAVLAILLAKLKELGYDCTFEDIKQGIHFKKELDLYLFKRFIQRPCLKFGRTPLAYAYPVKNIHFQPDPSMELSEEEESGMRIMQLLHWAGASFLDTALERNPDSFDSSPNNRITLLEFALTLNKPAPLKALFEMNLGILKKAFSEQRRSRNPLEHIIRANSIHSFIFLDKLRVDGEAIVDTLSLPWKLKGGKHDELESSLHLATKSGSIHIVVYLLKKLQRRDDKLSLPREVLRSSYFTRLESSEIKKCTLLAMFVYCKCFKISSEDVTIDKDMLITLASKGTFGVFQDLYNFAPSLFLNHYNSGFQWKKYLVEEEETGKKIKAFIKQKISDKQKQDEEERKKKKQQRNAIRQEQKEEAEEEQRRHKKREELRKTEVKRAKSLLSELIEFLETFAPYKELSPLEKIQTKAEKAQVHAFNKAKGAGNIPADLEFRDLSERILTLKQHPILVAREELQKLVLDTSVTSEKVQDSPFFSQAVRLALFHSEVLPFLQKLPLIELRREENFLEESYKELEASYHKSNFDQKNKDPFSFVFTIPHNGFLLFEVKLSHEENFAFSVECRFFLAGTEFTAFEEGIKNFSLKEILAQLKKEKATPLAALMLTSEVRERSTGGGAGGGGGSKDDDEDKLRRLGDYLFNNTAQAVEVLDEQQQQEFLEELRTREDNLTLCDYLNKNDLLYNERINAHFRSQVEEGNKEAFKKAYRQMIDQPNNGPITLVHETNKNLKFKCYHVSTGAYNKNSGKSSLFWTYDEEDIFRVLAIGYHTNHHSYKLDWVNEDWSEDNFETQIPRGIYTIQQ